MPDGCSRQDGAGEGVTKRDGLPDEDGRQGGPCIRVSLNGCQAVRQGCVQNWTGPPVAFVILTHGVGCRGAVVSVPVWRFESQMPKVLEKFCFKGGISEMA